MNNGIDCNELGTECQIERDTTPGCGTIPLSCHFTFDYDIPDRNHPPQRFAA